jgi:hypothetical protein
MKTYMKSRGRALLTLNLSSRWKTVVNFMLQTQYQYPFNWRLGGPQGKSGCFEKEKTLLLLLRFKP